MAKLECAMCGTQFLDIWDVRESPVCPTCGVSQYTEVGQTPLIFRNRSTGKGGEEAYIPNESSVYWDTYKEMSAFLDGLAGMDPWASHKAAMSCADRAARGLPISKRVAAWNAYKKMRYKKREIIGEAWNYATTFENDALELDMVSQVWGYLKKEWNKKYSDTTWDRVVDVVTIRGTAEDRREYGRLKYRFEGLVQDNLGAIKQMTGNG